MTVILYKEEQCETGGSGDVRGQNKKNLQVFRSVDILISGDIQVNDCLLIIANTITDSFGDNSSVKFRNYASQIDCIGFRFWAHQN